ncbi:MAG: sugar transferase [Candidatus Cloacimonetes bacterium]|nr:sugar transferase [Candidatus Cloacimonadota bacterium]
MKHKITKSSLFILDIALVVFAFLFAAKIRSGTKGIILTYYRSFVPFLLIWIGSGVWGEKFSVKTISSGVDFVRRIFKCNLVAITAIFGLMFILGRFHYSRYIVFGTILTTFSLELFLFIGVYYAMRFNKENQAFAATRLLTRSSALEELQGSKFFLDAGNAIPVICSEAYALPFAPEVDSDSVLIPLWKKYLDEKPQLFDFLNDFLDLSRFNKQGALVLNTETYFNIQNEAAESRQIFINLHKINDYRRLNYYLIRVNELLQDGGVFVCNGQTILESKSSFYQRFTPYLGSILYGLDFLFRRVMPKLPILQGWYFALTRGKNRALSETEMLGRFYFCGFELIHKREIEGMMHFILKKARPASTDPNPTYGPLIRLKRKGKDGKIIYIKKFRTMHPYSEYLQDYVFQTNALQEGGKFADDFRITSWGAVLRKLWIDELPQFINFFKGELALVGVRALSEHYFKLYPQDMQELRLKVKPGLVPPFYADMPKSFEEIVESERRYLMLKMDKPLTTDWVYFWRSVWNILVKRARSN